MNPRSVRKSRQRPVHAFRPSAERLDARLVLSTLPSTFVARNSVGQTIGNVVNDTSLGGLNVDSTAGFPTDFTFLSIISADDKKLLATVSYNTNDTEHNAFTTLAQPAGDPGVKLEGNTAVSQAVNGKTIDVTTQFLSKDPFDLVMKGTSTDFSSSGNLYVQATGGTYIVSYQSLSTTNVQTTFQNCSIIGSFGLITSFPFSATVNPGSFLVQSAAPMIGRSTSINTAEIHVEINTPFELPILSKDGFEVPTGGGVKYALVYMTDRKLAVVSYTGITENIDPATNKPIGGYVLQGCVSKTAGTIGLFGSGAAQTANVQWTSADPIDFEFTNNSGRKDIYVAIAGQQVDPIANTKTYGYLSPDSTDGANWNFHAFDGSQSSVPTTQIFPGTDPSNTVANLKVPNDPFLRLDSIRVIFSVGSPPVIPVVNKEPQFPAASNDHDPNNAITYDFVEFTERSSPNDGILFINTTQVDQVGMPFLMQTTPIDPVKSGGVGIQVSRSKLYYDFGQFVSKRFEGLSGNNVTDVVAAYSALTTPHRLLNPSDAITNPPSDKTPAVFGSYFDAALTAFFKKYQGDGNTFKFQRDGYYFVGQTVTGFTPPSSTQGGYTVLQLKESDSSWNLIDHGQQYQIYAPYFSNGSPYPTGFPASSTTPPPAPTWVGSGQVASSGLMVFGNSGVFADGAAQEKSGQLSGKNATGQILLDIENSIVSAFNRGIANKVPAGDDVTSYWNDSSKFYEKPIAEGTNWANYYANFLHQDDISKTAPGSNVGLAYGFAYDDQGGNDPTLVSPASKVAITLQPWTATTSIVISPSTLTAVSGTETSFTVTAYKDKDKNIVDTDYLGKISFDPKDVTGWLPPYQFTPNDNGVHVFRFTPQVTGSQDYSVVANDLANDLKSNTLALHVDPAHIAYAAGTDSGTDPVVKLFDARNVEVLEIVPFESSFKGGVRVAVGDVNGDGYEDPAVVSGPGRVTEVLVFDGRNGNLISRQRPFGDSFTGGGYVAAGDLDSDGRDEILVTSGAGITARLLVLNGQTGQPIYGKTAFHQGFKGGATVATADIDGDGKAEIVIGAGDGGGGKVRVLDGRTAKVLKTFQAFGAGYRGSVALTAGDLFGDELDEIIVGSGPIPGSGSQASAFVRAFDGRGRLISSIRTGVVPGSSGLRFGTAPDRLRRGKQNLLVNGGSSNSQVESYRVVNVSPNPRRPTYVANLVSVVYPLGSQNTSGFFLGGSSD